MNLPTAPCPERIPCTCGQTMRHVGHAFYSLAIYSCPSCGRSVEWHCETGEVVGEWYPSEVTP